MAGRWVATQPIGPGYRDTDLHTSELETIMDIGSTAATIIFAAKGRTPLR